MKKIFILIPLVACILQSKSQTVSDVDGNTYNTVTIGTQVWMKENLKTTKYNDNTEIPYVTNDNSWNALTTPAYCWLSNISNNKATYGALYNWYSVNTDKLCPTGWHVPSNDEWTKLSNYLNDSDVAGKIKSTTDDWNSPNKGATNESGFTALPGGSRDKSGYFLISGIGAYFWTSTESSNDAAHNMEAHYNSSTEQRLLNNEKQMGLSVRCINDISTSADLLEPIDNIFIYPNPASDKVFIKNYKSEDAFAVIYDLNGKQIINIHIDSNPINISNLPKGIYFIKVIDSDNIVTYKLVKD